MAKKYVRIDFRTREYTFIYNGTNYRAIITSPEEGKFVFQLYHDAKDLCLSEGDDWFYANNSNYLNEFTAKGIIADMIRQYVG